MIKYALIFKAEANFRKAYRHLVNLGYSVQYSGYENALNFYMDDSGTAIKSLGRIGIEFMVDFTMKA